MDKSRANFEAWAREELRFEDRDFRFGFLEADEYSNHDTRFAYRGWQASRKQALEEAARECETNARYWRGQAGDGGTVLDDGKALGGSMCADDIRSLEGNATKETT